MHCQYKDICKECGCAAKVFTQPKANMEGQIGKPDLIVLFTNPISHEMAKIARTAASKCGIALAQSHTGSGSALRGILREHRERCGAVCH
jgi:glutamate synthase domain-containing protein 2